MIKNQHLFVTSALYVHVEILQVPFGVRGQIMSLLESIESGRVESFFASVRYPTVVSTPCLEHTCWLPNLGLSSSTVRSASGLVTNKTSDLGQ